MGNKQSTPRTLKAAQPYHMSILVPLKLGKDNTILGKSYYLSRARAWEINRARQRCLRLRSHTTCQFGCHSSSGRIILFCATLIIFPELARGNPCDLAAYCVRCSFAPPFTIAPTCLPRALCCQAMLSVWQTAAYEGESGKRLVRLANIPRGTTQDIFQAHG